jgi:hypothetical protein
MRVLALLAAYNEERFIGGCLEHLVREGCEAYLIDNDSTDATVAIAERFLGNGLAGIERFPRNGVYSWRPLLIRKAELASELEADWFLHMDPDELRMAPFPGATLRDALAEVDREGYNTVNFQEFTFVPTAEAPDHDHADFVQTMRWYYPFMPRFPHQLKAWKRQVEPVELTPTDGHEVQFSGRRIYPESFPMRHYLFLSVPHAIEKYVQRVYDPGEVAEGAHAVRAALRPESFRLLPEAELRTYGSDDTLDGSNPFSYHLALGIEPPADSE